MMVSGVGSYSSTMYSNVRLSSTDQSSQLNQQQSNAAGKQGGAEGPGGPGGPRGQKGPPPGGGKGNGPKVDTNKDSVWDAEELQALSEELSSNGATSFDVEEFMSTYDTDNDQVISQSEQSVVKENNGFNLPQMGNMQQDMKNIQQVMMSGSKNLQIQKYSEITTEEKEDTVIQKILKAYEQQTKYSENQVDPILNLTTN